MLVSRLPMAVVRLLLLQPTSCEWLHVLLRIISRLLLMISIIMRRRAKAIAIRLRLRRWCGGPAYHRADQRAGPWEA